MINQKVIEQPSAEDAIGTNKFLFTILYNYIFGGQTLLLCAEMEITYLSSRVILD
jgi:hypothetical protein